MINFKINKLFLLYLYQFSTFTSKGTIIYKQFLQSSSKSFKVLNKGRRSKQQSMKIHVPYKKMVRKQVISFFQTYKIYNKNVIVTLDPSHVIGLHRLYQLQYLKKSVYKGIAKPVDLLRLKNPDQQVRLGQLELSSDLFFLMDPLFQSKRHQLTYEQLWKTAQNRYENDKQRGVIRLSQQYNTPKQFQYIIQTAHNNDNRIYFGGINQYQFRKILTIYFNLLETKRLFYSCLVYAFNKSENFQNFKYFTRQYIWNELFDVLNVITAQKIQNLMKKIPNSFVFGHQFIFENISENKRVKIKKDRDKNPDSDKIQKNALLEVLLGKLWSQPYTNNPFPYIVDNYHKLSIEDKQLIIQLYNIKFQQYRNVVNQYYFMINKKKQNQQIHIKK